MLREQRKEGRRRIILHATEALIRETSSTDFSMRHLAVRTGFSLATTYNLIGSKATVLYALLSQCMDRVDSARLATSTPGDAVEHVFQAADAAVMIYTADPNFYRPLMRFLLGVPDPVHRPLFMERAYRYWWTVTQPLYERNALREAYGAQALARDLQVFFAGAIDLWVHNELNDVEFRAQIRMGVAIRLLSLGLEPYAARLKREVGDGFKVIAPLLPAID